MSECNDCEGLSIDLLDEKTFLCMYDDHYSNVGLEKLYKKCPKKEQNE